MKIATHFSFLAMLIGDYRISFEVTTTDNTIEVGVLPIKDVHNEFHAKMIAGEYLLRQFPNSKVIITSCVRDEQSELKRLVSDKSFILSKLSFEGFIN